MSTTATGDTIAITEAQRALIGRNFILHQQFAQAMLGDEALAAEIPRGAMLVLLPDQDTALREANIEAGLAALRRGHHVYFRQVYRQATPPQQSGGVAYGPRPEPPTSSPGEVH